MNTAFSASAGDVAATPRRKLRGLLAGMMFLEYAVWGAWMPILSATLISRNVPGGEVGNIYGGMWLACIITPFLGGQLADRWMPAQKFLSLAHLLAAGAALVDVHANDFRRLLLGNVYLGLDVRPDAGRHQRHCVPPH